MSAILLALGSALGYGASDFLAGWLSRKSDYARVGLLSQVSAATGTVLVAALVGGPASTPSLAWGVFAGLGGGIGTLALYRGLGRGRMNVVAPLSGVLAAGLPALVGFALGERPSAWAMVGLVLALPAVWLTSSADGVQGRAPQGTVRDSIADGVLAGVGFAVLFIGLQRGGRGGGLWSSAASQLASAIPMIGLYVWKSSRGGVELPPASSRFVRLGPLLGGVLAALAVTAYFLATQRGMLTVVAVLTSLYPAVTVALARGLLGEHIGRRQGAGLALAGISVALISAA
jgi:drug/metabolite transporter (DMT)-like permease